MTRSSFMEKFERLGQRLAADPVLSGSPGAVRIGHKGGGNTIAAIMTLRRRGMTVLKAKRTIEAAVDRQFALAFLPSIEDWDQLKAELAAAGFDATPAVEAAAPDIKGLRARLAMTQEEFAGFFDLDLDAVRNWEHGRRRPDRAAMAYLALIDRDPAAVAALLRRPA